MTHHQLSFNPENNQLKLTISKQTFENDNILSLTWSSNISFANHCHQLKDEK
jgi:hypothetical protein